LRAVQIIAVMVRLRIDFALLRIGYPLCAESESNPKQSLAIFGFIAKKGIIRYQGGPLPQIVLRGPPSASITGSRPLSAPRTLNLTLTRPSLHYCPPYRAKGKRCIDNRSFKVSYVWCPAPGSWKISIVASNTKPARFNLAARHPCMDYNGRITLC
jgi:hypothetical protein